MSLIAWRPQASRLRLQQQQVGCLAWTNRAPAQLDCPEAQSSQLALTPQQTPQTPLTQTLAATAQAVLAPQAHNRAKEVLSGSKTLSNWTLCSAAARDTLGHRPPCGCWWQPLAQGRGPQAVLAAWQPGDRALHSALTPLRQLLGMAGLQGLGAQTLQGLQAAQQRA